MSLTSSEGRELCELSVFGFRVYEWQDISGRPMRSVACVRDDRQTATQRRYQPLHTVSVSVCLSLSLSLYLCVCVFVYLPVSAGMSISISLPPVPKCSLTIRLPVSVTFYFHFIPSPIGHSHFLPYYSISSQLLLFFMDTVKQITSKLT